MEGVRRVACVLFSACRHLSPGRSQPFGSKTWAIGIFREKLDVVFRIFPSKKLSTQLKTNRIEVAFFFSTDHYTDM